MLQSCLGFHPSFGIPNQTPCYEIHEVFILAPKDLCKRFSPWSSPAPFGVHHWPWSTIIIEEEPFPRAAVNEVLVWGPQYLHNTRQLLLLVFTGEDGEASEQFGKDATQTPHINAHVIVHAKDDLRRTVEAALNVRVDLFVFEAAAPKVNDFDGALGGMLQ